LQASGCESNNGTKGTPGLQADLFGDWREELVFRTSNPSKIRIFTTTVPGTYRNYTLMHDRQYRLAIAWQNVAYNQPPHPSYFLGEAEGIVSPPPPVMTNGRLVYKGGGIWDNTSEAWTLDGQNTVYSDGRHVFLTGPQGTNDSIELSGTLQPSVLSMASPGRFYLNGENGTLSGNMKLIKQGSGVFSLDGTHDFSGPTEVWDGKMIFSGSLSASPLWLNINAESDVVESKAKAAEAVESKTAEPEAETVEAAESKTTEPEAEEATESTETTESKVAEPKAKAVKATESDAVEPKAEAVESPADSKAKTAEAPAEPTEGKTEEQAAQEDESKQE
jgi:autotransporter-associated beta strand protein